MLLAITVCKPGKRAGLRSRLAAPPRFPIVTVVAIRAAKSERQQEAEQVRGLVAEREMMAVAKAAREQHGNSNALWRFVRENHLRGEMYQAGVTYAEIVRDARIALGLHVPGQPHGPGADSSLDDGQLAARKEFAMMARAAADHVLFNRARINAMIRLTYDEIHPPIAETRMLVTGLYALARHFGLTKEGINEGKPT